MTLNELLIQAMVTSQQMTSGDLPLRIDGMDVDDIKFRIHLDGDVQPYVSMEIWKR